MIKILNKRLETLSAFILDNECVIDIGCDHGLLGIYLFLNRKNLKMISSDVNRGPLEKAQENLEKYNLVDKIELRLGNGLQVMSNDINTIVISGMGGITITNILQNINKYKNVSKLVLSPNNEFPYVRKTLSKLGFYIVNEKMVLEKGKYYLVSEYKRGKGKVNYYFGKLDLQDKIVKSYYENLYNKNKKILENLSLYQKLKCLNLIKENILIKRKYRLNGK